MTHTAPKSDTTPVPADSGTDSIDPREFREALGHFATGVTVITASSGAGLRAGLTANSFSSVSLNPPLVLWSLALHAPSLTVFQDASHFCIHVLSQEQEDLARHFAKSSAEKFAGLEVGEGLGGTPLLGGAIARFQCRSVYRYYGGDHIIFLGQVEAMEKAEGRPLIFYRGAFADLTEPA